jgi:hypothetical protein
VKTLDNLRSAIVWRLFPLFEKKDIHLLPTHYYNPISIIRELKEKKALFNSEHRLSGVDIPSKK